MMFGVAVQGQSWNGELGGQATDDMSLMGCSHLRNLYKFHIYTGTHAAVSMLVLPDSWNRKLSDWPP